MDTSTQPGDENKSLDVDSTAALLESRAVDRETSQNTDEPEAKTEIKAEDYQGTEVDNAEIEANADDSTDDTDQSDPAEQEDAGTTDESTSFQTLAEVAEAADMSLDDFISTVKMTTKVNGEETEKSIADIVKGYQLESDFTRKNQDFVEEQKQFKESQEAAQAEIKLHMQKAGHAFQMAQNQLTSEFNSIDWNGLQSTDPTQYMLKRQQFGERQAQINQQIEQATAQAQQFTNQQAEIAETNRTENINKQAELLVKAIPEWSDSKVRQADEAKITDFLTARGFTNDDGELFIDHRLTLLARDAMKGGKVSDAIDIAKKKVNKVPKLVKSNARQNQKSSDAKRVDKLQKRFKTTGSTDDLAALLNSRRA